MATERQQLVFEVGKGGWNDGNTGLHVHITSRKLALSLIESMARALYSDSDEPTFEFSTLIYGNLRPLQEDD